MFEDLLPAVEKSILEAAGSIPVVFEGIEHCFEKSTPVPSSSRHSSHELLYLRSGTAELTIAGKTVPLDKGSTVVIRPNVNHTIKVISKQADMVVLYFGFSQDVHEAQEALRASSPNAKLGPRDRKTGPSAPVSFQGVSPKPIESFLDFARGQGEDSQNASYLSVSGRSRQDIGDLVQRIMKESASDAFAKDLMMQFLTMELLVALSRALREEWEESLRVRHGKARELVLIAKDYLSQNHGRGVSVADAAAYVFLSQGYFTRAFRDEFGISPMGYLMQVRVNAACSLLEQKEIKVSGIAMQVGFSSPQRFNVAFRKQMGMTPMQYRNRMLPEKTESQE
jgi:AraC-like DNA-binding protein